MIFRRQTLSLVMSALVLIAYCLPVTYGGERTWGGSG